MPLAGLPAPLAGWAAFPSAASVVVSSIGLALLRATRLSVIGWRGQALYAYGLLGVFGALLTYVGLVLEAVPMLVGVATDSDAIAAALVRCLIVPVCWVLERCVLFRRPLGPLQNAMCFFVFVGSLLLEETGPRPYDNVSLGLAGEIAGCDGGFRSPFLIYVSVWLTSIIFGALLIILAGARSSSSSAEGHAVVSDRETESANSAPMSPEALRRKALPVLHGLCASMAGLVFSTGAAVDDMRWILFGAVLLAVAVACAWDWLWRLELSLAAWAATSHACLTMLRLVQGHLVFRDFRWASENEHDQGNLVVDKWPGLQLFLFGILLLYCTLMLFLSLNHSDAALGEISATAAAHAEGERGDLGDEKAPRPRIMSVDSLDDESLLLDEVIRPLPLVAWALFPVCVCTLVLGVSLPVIHYDMMTPDLVYESSYTVRTDSGTGYHSRQTQSYLDLITNLYDRRLPCSALAVACTSAIIPPVQFALTAILLVQPACVPRAAQQLARSTLMNSAPSRFSGPMLLMMFIAILNFSGPGTRYFRASLGSGFWFFVGYCIASLLLALSLEIDADRHSSESGKKKLKRTLSPCGPCPCKLEAPPKNHDSSVRTNSWRAMSSGRTHRSEEDGSLEDGASSPSSSDGDSDAAEQSCCTIPVSCIAGVAAGLAIIVGVSTFLGLTKPFLVFEYRLSGVVVDTASPTPLELWKDMQVTNPWLGHLAALTLVIAMLFWLPLLAATAAMAWSASPETFGWKLWYARRLEKTLRPLVMGHVWAASIVCILYMVMARNKAVMEVCVRVPERPDGLVAVAVMGCSVFLLHELAKLLGPSGRPSVDSGGSLTNGLLRLPGGCCLWMLAPPLVAMFWVGFFYRHGPHEPPAIRSLGDVNDVLFRLNAPANEKLRAHIPWSAGDCVQLWEWRLLKDQAMSSQSEKYARCLGRGPLAQITQDNPLGKNNMTIKASWATGLSSLRITDMRVKPPADILAETQRWTLTIGGMFTELKVYLKVLMGDKLWIDNDPMCCTNPFHFAVQLSATCRRGKGFDDVKLEVVHIDKIEFVDSVTHTFGVNQASYQINYGSSGLVEKALENFMTLKNAKILISNPADQSTTDPLSRMGSVLEHIVWLNMGHHCPYNY